MYGGRPATTTESLPRITTASRPPPAERARDPPTCGGSATTASSRPRMGDRVIGSVVAALTTLAHSHCVREIALGLGSGLPLHSLPPVESFAQETLVGPHALSLRSRNY